MSEPTFKKSNYFGLNQSEIEQCLEFQKKHFPNTEGIILKNFTLKVFSDYSSLSETILNPSNEVTANVSETPEFKQVSSDLEKEVTAKKDLQKEISGLKSNLNSLQEQYKLLQDAHLEQSTNVEVTAKKLKVLDEAIVLHFTPTQREQLETAFNKFQKLEGFHTIQDMLEHIIYFASLNAKFQFSKSKK